MSKYFIRVSNNPSFRGGVYGGGNTIAEARKAARSFVEEAPDADIAIVKSALYHKTRNPHEERLVIVESVQSHPIGGRHLRDPVSGGTRKPLVRRFNTQAEIDKTITDYIARGNKAEQKRDRAPYESAEYWRQHDIAVKWWTKAESLMPGGSHWRRKAAAEGRRLSHDPTSYRPRPLFPGLPTSSRISGKRRIRWYGDLDFLPPSVVNLTAVHNATTKKDLLKAGLPEEVIETLKETTGSSNPRRIAGHFIFLADRGIF